MNRGEQTTTRSVEETAQRILGYLSEAPRDDSGYAWVFSKKLQEATGLSPMEINDAVAILQEWGFVELLRYLGTAPFIFGQVAITPRGRYEWERMKSLQARKAQTIPSIPIRPPTPVGSPYGFTDEDWEIVAEAKSKSGEIRIVLGHPFESEHFDADQLKINVEEMFRRALGDYLKRQGSIRVSLQFKALAAGYGEHLFNEIARDVISADIAVFDTSDLNPNVMIEMGVALTWGIRVLPIKNEKCPKPPSDISGQTWADYRDSGGEFVDEKHHEKLIAMIERAARKKVARA